MSSEGFTETLFFRPMQIKLNFSTNAAEMHRVDLSFLFCHQNVTFKTTFPSGWELVGVNLECGPVCVGSEHIGDPLSFALLAAAAARVEAGPVEPSTSLLSMPRINASRPWR